MGLPDGAPHARRPDVYSDESARAALAAIDPSVLEPARREPMLAWLRAYRHHWPTRWAREMAPLGERRIAELEALEIDENRYLKLRRIAIENLATLI